VVENLRTAEGEIILADDFADADGVRVLNFAQAQRAVRGPRAARGGLTVADVMARYATCAATDGLTIPSTTPAGARRSSSCRQSGP
jgi:hypothetical protein